MTNTNYTPRGPERRQLLRTFKQTFWLVLIAMFALGYFVGSWNAEERAREMFDSVNCYERNGVE